MIIEDFLSDYKNELKLVLQKGGVSVSSDDVNELSRIYWEWDIRKVSLKPRTVHFSKEFQAPTDTVGIDALKKITIDFETGKDVNKYQSRAFSDPKHFAFCDMMFNDWGIKHFHLQSSIEKDGFVKRTDTLLFAFLTENDAYFINTSSHKSNPHGSWVDKVFIEIINSNWPRLLWKLPPSITTKIMTETEIKTLRAKRGNYMLKLSDGSVVTASHGYSSSGNNFNAIRQHIKCLNSIDLCKAWVVDNEDVIINSYKSHGIELSNSLELELVFGKNGYFGIREKSSAQLMLLGAEFPFQDAETLVISPSSILVI